MPARPPAHRIELHGHRGARGLWPENTREGFVRAIALGLDAIELDVAMTRDDVVVVAHDHTLNPDLTRGPDGRWIAAPGARIRDLPAAALAGYDVGRLKPGTAYAALFPDQTPLDGARIPTLADIFRLPPPIRFNIETKTYPDHPDRTVDGPTLVAGVLAAADRAGVAERIIVQSFDWSGLRRLRRARPEIAVSFLTEARTVADARTWWDGMALAEHAGSVPRAVLAAGAGRPDTCWGPRHDELTAGLIAEAHAIGLRVIPWTVNRPTDMRRLIGWGVDGLITDRPDLARREMAACGHAVPPGSYPAA